MVIYSLSSQMCEYKAVKSNALFPFLVPRVNAKAKHILVGLLVAIICRGHCFGMSKKAGARAHRGGLLSRLIVSWKCE